MTPIQSVAGRMEIEESVIARIRQRRDAGRSKYGVSMERDDLSVEQWLKHAQEEALDFAIYLEKLKTVRVSDAFAAGERKGRLDNISLLSEAVSILRSIETPVAFEWHQRQILFLSKLDRIRNETEPPQL